MFELMSVCTRVSKLTIEGHANYCPNNPDDPACAEFLHDTSNKRPAENGSVCGQEPSYV